MRARFPTRTSAGRFPPNVNGTWQEHFVLTPNTPAAIRPDGGRKAYGPLTGTLGLTVDSWGAKVSFLGRNLTGHSYWAQDRIAVP